MIVTDTYATVTDPDSGETIILAQEIVTDMWFAQYNNSGEWINSTETVERYIGKNYYVSPTVITIANFLLWEHIKRKERQGDPIW